jgi:hypothetical protein
MMAEEATAVLVAVTKAAVASIAGAEARESETGHRAVATGAASITAHRRA